MNQCGSATRNGHEHLPDAVLDLKRKILPTAISERGLKHRERSKVMELMTDMRVAELGLVDEKRLRRAYSDYLQGGEGRNSGSL